MTVEQFVNDILSSTFGSILEIIIGVAILVLIVLSKTKFGKKLLLELAAKIAASESRIDKKIQELENTKKQLEEEHKKTVEEIENKYAEQANKLEKLENFLLKALESINNVNVKRAITDYKNLKDKYLNEEPKKVAENGEKE